jgi:hypothetical protein
MPCCQAKFVSQKSYNINPFQFSHFEFRHANHRIRAHAHLHEHTVPYGAALLGWHSPSHFVPGYDRSVPPGHFATGFSYGSPDPLNIRRIDPETDSRAAERRTGKAWIGLASSAPACAAAGCPEAFPSCCNRAVKFVTNWANI